MTIRAEYTTVNELRASYLGATQTTDDALILQMIRATSRMIDGAAQKVFFPQVATRYFDIPNSRELDFDEWALSVTTLTNGAGGTITSANYNLIPKNSAAYYGLALTQTQGAIWQPDTSGNTENAIAVLGVWGYAPQDSNQFVATGGTLAAAITSTSATTFTATTGTIKAGYLLQIDSEYLYASAVTTGASDTVTVERGVNGSTAATHLISTAISRWTPGEMIEQICRAGAAAMYKQKSNPVGESVMIDGQTFATVRDVSAYIRAQLAAMGLMSTH